MKVICTGCSIEFEAKRKTRKFHSEACEKAYARSGGQMVASAIEATYAVTEKGGTVDLTTGEILNEYNVTPDATVINAYDPEAELAAFQKMGLDPVTWITTGIPEFDELTQIPRGRVTQIQGPYAVGKTTLALNMIQGLTHLRVLYIDTEAALNPALMVSLGVRSANFTLWNKSSFIEDIYDVILEAVASPRYDLIILDSLAACTFKTEAQGEATAANIGQKARVVGKLMRIIPMELKATGTALVVINQEREVIGSYAPIKYTPGGMGVPYAASLMISLKTTKGARFPKTGPPFKGHEVTAEIIKSKVNDPWRKATFKLYYGETHGNL